MSYQAVSGHPRSSARMRSRGFRPVSGLLDANINSKSYYIPLVEVFDDKLGRRSYAWGQRKYLSNWDALSYAQSLSKNLGTGYQRCTLYEWSNNAWRKSSVPTF